MLAIRKSTATVKPVTEILFRSYGSNNHLPSTYRANLICRLSRLDLIKEFIFKVTGTEPFLKFLYRETICTIIHRPIVNIIYTI